MEENDTKIALESELTNNSENSEEIQNTEVEFDDNVLSDNNKQKAFDDFEFDIDYIQNQLKRHMEGHDIIYTPQAGQPKAALNEIADEAPEQNSILTAENTIAENKDEQNIEYISPTNSITVSIESPLDEVQDENNTDQAEQKNLPAEIQETKPEKNNSSKKENADTKRYVIHIDRENVEFMDKLSIDERNEIINKIIKNQHIKFNKFSKIHDLYTFANQVVIMVLTIVIGIPVFFVVLNKSIDITISNYKQSEQNFIKLYKEKGKIKNKKEIEKQFL
ncbi:hypothetical protein IJG72_00065 [bacterium]|nr:hypothetical protein [bacterium]